MPDGQLLSRLLTGRPLAPATVARWGIEIAQTLSRLHARGRLHRDLKPANIMVKPDGSIELLDFGVGVLGDRLDDAGVGGSGVAPHVMVGAPQYSSPEQVRGGALDQRSDVFALGVVLYEMATGTRPFSGSTRDEIVRNILRGRPLSPLALAPELPAALSRVILRALALEPAQRYPGMTELMAELQAAARQLKAQTAGPLKRPGLVGAAVAAAVLLVSGAVFLWLRAPPNPHAVLVVPMEVRGTPDEGGLLGRSLAEAVAVNLAQAAGLSVRPVPDPAELGGGGSAGRAQAARRVGAGSVLVGTVTRDGDTVRVSVSLLDSRENRIIWGTSAAGPDTDLTALAANLARQTAVQLGGSFPKLYDHPGGLTGGPAMAASPHTSLALAALRGGDVTTLLSESGKLAEEFPQELDARVLQSLALLLAWDARPSASLLSALEASLAALDRLEAGNPYAPFFRAYLLHVDGQSRRAINQFSSILARSDLTPSARAWMLRYRAMARAAAEGRETALEDLEQALALDPASARTFQILSQTLLSVGRPQDALVRAHQAVALMPSYWRNHETLGLAHSALHEYAQARDAFATACQLGHAQVACALHALALLHTNDAAGARTAANAAAALPEDPAGVYNLACYTALTGDTTLAVKHLRRAVTLGFDGADIATDPDLASLRDRPEFAAIVAAVQHKSRQRQ